MQMDLRSNTRIWNHQNPLQKGTGYQGRMNSPTLFSQHAVNQDSLLGIANPTAEENHDRGKQGD